jgi:hypothetical protein
LWIPGGIVEIICAVNGASFEHLWCPAVRSLRLLTTYVLPERCSELQVNLNYAFLPSSHTVSPTATSNTKISFLDSFLSQYNCNLWLIVQA